MGKFVSKSGCLIHGCSNTANGLGVHAEGICNVVLGEYNSIRGCCNDVTCNINHAEGFNNTINTGEGSHAEGHTNTITRSSAHAEGFTNTITGYGDYAHAEGGNNTLCGRMSHVEGMCNLVTGCSSHAEGLCHTISGCYSHAEGFKNTISTCYSHAEGMCSCPKLHGQFSTATGAFAAVGDAQYTRFIMRGATTDDTQTILTSPEPFTIEEEKAYALIITVVGREDTGAAHGMFKLMQIIQNTGGTTAVDGTEQTIGTDINDDSWGGVTLTANDTTDILEIKVTGKTGTNIRWVALVEAVEVIYAD